MTDSFVTRCPHCSTRLRITYEQISAAAGMVRCGTCLHTFNAHEHLLDDSPQSVAAGMDDLLIHDDLDLHDLGLDDLNLDEELAQIEAQEQAFSKELLDLSQQIEGDERGPVSRADETWAEALLREEEGATDSLEEAAQHPEQPHSGALWLPYKESLDEETTPLPEHLSVAARPGHSSRLTPSLSIQKDNFADFAQALEDDEVLARPGRKRLPEKRRKQALWTALTLLTALVLGGEYVFFHFDTLVREERYRPWFAKLCPLIGCQLPSQVDLSQIRSSNLVVHSHPQFSGALMVDVILYNHAAFAQPFPLLELEFSNLAGLAIAHRRFTPAQYLAGEMQGKQQMPPQVPIHIALEIQDPGSEAVNYRLSVRSAK